MTGTRFLRRRDLLRGIACLPLLGLAEARPTALVGANIVDVRNGVILRNRTLMIESERITRIVRPGDGPIGADWNVVACRGRYLIPGIVDTNVHLALYFPHQRVYWRLRREIALEQAQRFLKHGVTTVRDTAGVLQTTMELRDQIAVGTALGPRILVAGNILGWTGTFSADELTEEQRRSLQEDSVLRVQTQSAS